MTYLHNKKKLRILEDAKSEVQVCSNVHVVIQYIQYVDVHVIQYIQLCTCTCNTIYSIMYMYM